MRSVVYYTKNISPLIDNPTIENKKQLISTDKYNASFFELPAEAQSEILSSLPVPDFGITLNHESNDPIKHDCGISNNHDDNVKALIKIGDLSTFNYNDERTFVETNCFKLYAKIDAIDTSCTTFLKFKKRDSLKGDSFTAGEKAFILCHMKVWNIQICHYIEYNAKELKISKFEFNKAEYQKIENYLNQFTKVLLSNLAGQIPPKDGFQNKE